MVSPQEAPRRTGKPALFQHPLDGRRIVPYREHAADAEEDRGPGPSLGRLPVPV
jgi:hypothetical protein